MAGARKPLPSGFVARFWHCYDQASKFNLETEELTDYYIHRRLAAFLVGFMGALHMPWLFTPNRITFCSLAAGMYSAYLVLYSQRNPTLLFWAGMLELLSITLDCCDGQLARMYGMGSLVGRVLDGICDTIVAVTHGFSWLYVLMFDFKTISPVWGYSLFLIGFVTFQQQAMMYDRIKNLYCLNTVDVNEKVVGMEESEFIKKEIKDAWNSSSYVSYLLLQVYQKQYLAVQNMVAKKDIDSTLSQKKAHDPTAYRKQWKGTMRLSSFIGTGTHASLYYGCLFLAYFADSPGLLVWFFYLNNFALSVIWVICYYRVRDM